MAAVVFGLAAVVAVLIGAICLNYLSMTHRARDTADLAALAAAGQALTALDDHRACAEATRIAEANGAQVIDCEIVRAGVEVAVRVKVAVQLHWLTPGGSDEVVAEAYAGNPG